MSTEQLFRHIKSHRGYFGVYILSPCELADREHRKSKRQYAHTMHVRPRAPSVIETVCLAAAFWKLPIEFQLGLLLHEAAHIIRPDIDDEAKIDRLAVRELGIEILRVDSPYGKNLECIDEADVDVAVKVLDVMDLAYPDRRRRRRR